MTNLVTQPEDLGPGEHEVALKAVREVKDDRYGVNLIWELLCVEGAQKGRVHTRRTGSQLKRGKSLWTLVCGMLGRELEVGETFDTDGLIDERFSIRLRQEKRDDNDAVIVFDSIAPVAE